MSHELVEWSNSRRAHASTRPVLSLPKGSCFDKLSTNGLLSPFTLSRVEGRTGNGNRHCEERSDEAIWEEIATHAWGGLAMTSKTCHPERSEGSLAPAGRDSSPYLLRSRMLWYNKNNWEAFWSRKQSCRVGPQ